MEEQEDNIYDPAYVADLFDRCSGRYRTWSLVASFGFIWLWRRQCVARLQGQMGISALKGGPGQMRTPQVVDLMAGTGEIWPHLVSVWPHARIWAIDVSEAMHSRAVERLHSANANRIQHIQADALSTDIPEIWADLVVCTFGLKTLTPAGQTRLAERIARTLKPGACFALIEASDPKDWALRPLYRFYLETMLPLIERTVLSGAKEFSHLGIYTRNFGSCAHFAAALRDQGLFVSERRHFFGCATSVAGFKPVAQDDTTA